jgi:hypothetical protein
MPKRKSSRAAVRNTPQPKAHKYVEAVFTDDFGRERALTVSSAASFSKKKVDAASRAITRKVDRAMEQAIKAGDRETAIAIRKLRKQERETDRAIDRFFRRKIKTVKKPAKKLRHKPPKPRMIFPSRAQALPSYGGFIRDRQNRIGVYLDVLYYSSRTSRPGVAMRVTKYIWNGSALDDEGAPMFRSNVGATIDEVVCGFDHLEQVNRSAQKGAKILNGAVLAMDHRWTPEQMLAVGEAWAQERFGRYGLPYAIALHEPPPDGDQRNWHIHVIWSWRPLERVGHHEWLVSEVLRTDLDGREGLRFLRQRFAALSTEMSFRRGDCDVYTALSHAARGLPIEPQKKLYEDKTRRARAGEFVADNEDNHERVIRSKAAMIDDDLRREDERLAKLQEIARRAAARIARRFPTPRIPSVAYRIAKFGAVPGPVKLETLRPAKLRDVGVPRAPGTAMNPSSKAIAAILSSWKARMWEGKFANLRISARRDSPVVRAPAPATRPHLFRSHLSPIEPMKIARAVPAVAAPRPGFVLAAVTIPRQLRAPKSAMTLPIVAVPPIRSRAVLLSALNLRKAAVPPAATKAPVAPPVPPRSFAITRLKIPKPISIPAFARTIEGPSAPAVKIASAYEFLRSLKLPGKVSPPQPSKPISAVPAAPPVRPAPALLFTKLRRHPVPQAIDPETLAELELAMRRAKQSLRDDDGQEHEKSTQVQRQPVLPLQNANSPWLLLQLLGERRSLIAKDRTGRWALSRDLAKAAGLTDDQIASPSMQRTLEAEAHKQRQELEAVAAFIVADPRRRLIRTDAGWRAASSAPEALHALMYHWRFDPSVQRELERLSKETTLPLDAREQAGLRKRQFLDAVYRLQEPPQDFTRAMPQRGSGFPPPGWDGGREM